MSSQLDRRGLRVSGDRGGDERLQLGQHARVDRVWHRGLAPEEIRARSADALGGRTAELDRDDRVEGAVGDRRSGSRSRSVRSSSKPSTSGMKPDSAMIAAGRGRPVPRPSAQLITAPCEKPPRTTRSIGTGSASRNAAAASNVGKKVSGSGVGMPPSRYQWAPPGGKRQRPTWRDPEQPPLGVERVEQREEIALVRAAAVKRARALPRASPAAGRSRKRSGSTVMRPTRRAGRGAASAPARSARAGARTRAAGSTPRRGAPPPRRS